MPLGDMGKIVRAKRPAKLPVVLSLRETAALLSRLQGTARLMTELLYATGMRIIELVRSVLRSPSHVAVRNDSEQPNQPHLLPSASWNGLLVERISPDILQSGFHTSDGRRLASPVAEQARDQHTNVGASYRHRQQRVGIGHHRLVRLGGVLQAIRLSKQFLLLSPSIFNRACEFLVHEQSSLHQLKFKRGEQPCRRVW